MYHYVYRITNISLKKHYYGCRSSNIEPIFDLGIRYFSSSTDKEFIKDQKENTENYKYKIVRLFEDRKTAELFETFLHAKFEVQINESFYNKAQNTLMGFSVLGTKQSEEHKAKLTAQKIGRKLSETTKKKLSEKAKNRSPETRQKISEAKMGVPLSEEHKEAVSKGLLKRYEDEEFYDNFCKTMSEVNKREDKRIKAGEAIKDLWEKTKILNLK